MGRRSLIFAVLAVLCSCSSGTGTVTADLTDATAVDVAAGEVLAETVTLVDLVPDFGPLDLAPADLESDARAPDLSDQPGPGEAGYPCANEDDCNSGFCIQTPDGKQCTIACQSECPFGWQCVLHTPSLPDQVFICAPVHVDLCRPCTQNSDCMLNGTDAGQACVTYGAEGAFCGESCLDGQDCPDGYACTNAPDVAGGESSQCVLQQGQCGCAVWDIDAGSWTECASKNEYGTCNGTRLCLDTGLTPCDAPVPAAEICNMKDDDCDGDVDEETSGASCIVSNEFGFCPGTEKCVSGQLECQGKEPGKETCDGEDNDCDGDIDEGFPDTDDDGVADCLESDVDGDGIPDIQDNCPADFNPTQLDFDVDNFGDACDLDDDNDMTPDSDDCQPFNTNVNPGADEECDGVDNNCDFQVDEGFVDTDADGFKDCLDEDDDNDGFADPLDNCPLVANPEQKDADQDGAGDACDGDLDGDQKADAADNCPYDSNPGQEDLDQDGLGDACDPDMDGDAIPNAIDNCPNEKNTLQNDIDGDQVGDACDDDMDGDDLANEGDNCPLVANAGQEDADEDGLGDACEDDTDGDGTPDAADCAPDNPAIQPGVVEMCDGADNNCNGLIDEGFSDTDNDDLKDCADLDDDNDGAPDDADCQPLNGQIYPGAAELCNAQDDDCSGEIDDGLGLVSCGLGACEHSMDACAMGQWQVCNPFAGASAETCDGVDNDCDGVVDDDLGTSTCGLGTCLHSVPNCHLGQPQKCDPMEGSLAEICDGQDNNCNGLTDDGLGDTTCGQGACLHTVPNCVGGMDNPCNPMQGASPEVCDGVDNDCDELIDDNLGEVSCGQGECFHSQPYCHDGKVSICDPFSGVADEGCDGLDNDCDGLIDEGLGTTVCGLGICQHSVANCLEGLPLQCDPEEGAQQETCDGLDNNCDGNIDEDLGEVTCGKGQCLHTQLYCVDGKIAVCDPFLGAAGETCDTLDNDCDGLADEELGSTTCGLGVCEHTIDNCIGGLPQVCNPLEGSGLEICDNLDNDCDGIVDPEGAVDCTTYFADADFDTYGLTGSEKCLCGATLQYTAEIGGDCDDVNKDINPGVPDDCATSVDEDCSGAANDGCTYLNCLKVLDGNPDAATGTYLLDPDGTEGPKEPYEAHCDMEVDGGGWTLVAKVSGADAKQWGCKNQPGCGSSLWTSQATYNTASPFSANEDAKFQAYMDVKGSDIMFYDVVHGYALMYANDMYGARTLGTQVTQLAWKGGCTCCSEEYPVTWVKTGVAHVFCTGNDCSNNARIGWWCMDEEGWGSRDFNLIAMPNNSSFDYNFGNKPGLGSDRLDPGHSGGSSVDADGEKGGTSDGRKWPYAAAIFVR